MVSDGRKRADYQVLKQHKKVQKKHEISGDLQRPRLIGEGNGEQLQATGLPLPPDRESSRSRGTGRRGKGARIGVLLRGDLVAGGLLGSGWRIWQWEDLEKPESGEEGTVVEASRPSKDIGN